MWSQEKVNNRLLAVKNLPNIKTAKFIAAQKLKNTDCKVAFCGGVNRGAERSLPSHISEAGKIGNTSNWGVSVAFTQRQAEELYLIEKMNQLQ